MATPSLTPLSSGEPAPSRMRVSCRRPRRAHTKMQCASALPQAPSTCSPSAVIATARQPWPPSTGLRNSPVAIMSGPSASAPGRARRAVTATLNSRMALSPQASRMAPPRLSVRRSTRAGAPCARG